MQTSSAPCGSRPNVASAQLLTPIFHRYSRTRPAPVRLVPSQLAPQTCSCGLSEPQQRIALPPGRAHCPPPGSRRPWSFFSTSFVTCSSSLSALLIPASHQHTIPPAYLPQSGISSLVIVTAICQDVRPQDPAPHVLGFGQERKFLSLPQPSLASIGRLDGALSDAQAELTIALHSSPRSPSSVLPVALASLSPS